MYYVTVVSISRTRHTFSYNTREAYDIAINFVKNEAEHLTLVDPTIDDEPRP